MKRLIIGVMAAALLVLVLGAGAACGGGDDEGDDGGNVPTSAATPANGNGGDGNGDADDDGNVLRLVAKDTLFDKTELRAKAGEIRIELDNQDAGIVHNIHVYRGTDATGEDMGMTELEAGPVQQTLTLTLEAGEYFYVCDAHPATMSGTLIVEDD